jgi:ankyrin repeat protein
VDDLMVAKVTALTVAAGTGDSRRVAELLGEGVPVDARHEDSRYENCGKTALEKAVQADQVAVVRLLLRVGADPDQPIGDDGTASPLQFVTRVGDRPEMAVALLEGGAHPGGYHHRPGPAAIWSAALAGDTALVELLLDHGAAINEENDSVSPLAAAAAEGHSETVRLMLRKGARDAVGALAAVKAGIRRLADDPRRSARSPARLAEYTQTSDLLEAAVARAAGSDPVDPFVQKVVALTVAAEAGDTRRVAELVSEGVPVDARHEDPRCENYRASAMEMAVYADQVAVVRLLLSLGADPDQPIRDGSHRGYPMRFIIAEGWRLAEK